MVTFKQREACDVPGGGVLMMELVQVEGLIVVVVVKLIVAGVWFGSW